MTLQEIIDNFDLLDDWEDRYRYLIELGRELDPLPEAAHNDANKVRGCASQVWVESHVDASADGQPVLTLKGDSDAHIVRGLITLVFAIYSGKPVVAIPAIDAQPVFDKLDLGQHITPQRSNGVRSMIERIKADARKAAAATA